MTDETRSQSQPLTDIISRLKTVAVDDEVTVDRIADATGERGLLPLILVPALVAATPLSGIPGLSMVCGVLIALLSAELILGFRQFYLPGRLKRQKVSGRKLKAAMDRITPMIEWIDNHTGNRLSFLFHRPLIWLPQFLCLLSGLAMPFLEFIPFSSSIAAIGVCLLVMAMLTRDGLFFVLAMLPYGLGAYLGSKVLA